jgi:hypothetical protein
VWEKAVPLIDGCRIANSPAAALHVAGTHAPNAPTQPRSACRDLYWLLAEANVSAEAVPVRYREGAMHGFLELQTLDGKKIAYGETYQTVRGSRVTSRLIFRFSDGSLYDDSTVFTQNGTFHLVRDHLIQKGPSFKEAVDATVDAATGRVTVRTWDKSGKQKSTTEDLALPADVANGLLFTIIKDLPSGGETTLSMVATSGKPRIVKLHIIPLGGQALSLGTIHEEATEYIIKIDIGGIAGAIAPIIGKQPADTHVWVVTRGAPVVIRNEGPLYAEGPVWRMQQARPALSTQVRARPRSKPAARD